MATFSNDNFMNNKASTDVNVVGFANNALDGILKAIQEAKKATEDLGNRIGENEDRQDKKDAKDKVASVASERRQRAANAAIHGKIDKGFTLIGLVQKSLEKIANYVGDIATRTMKSLDDSVRTQRKLMLSSAQILANQKTASRIAGDVKNYGISPADVRRMTDALAEQGVLATDLSDKQLQLVAVAMNKNNMSAEKALKLAMQSRGEEDSLIKTLIQSTGSTGRKTTEDMLSKSDSSVFQIYAKSVGGMNQAISAYNQFAKQLDHNFGLYMGAEAQNTILESSILYQSGQIEKITDEQLKAIQGLGINANSSPEEIIKQIKSGLQNNKFNENSVRVLRSIEGFGDDFANSLLRMQTDFNKNNGELQTKNIQSGQENIDAAKASVEGGTIGNWLSNAFTKLDVISGGLFSGISTQLNEWFGEDASLEGVVTKGFPVVIGLLGAIAASSLISKGGGLLSSLATGIAGLTGLGGLGGLPDIPGGANTPDAPNGRGTPNAPNIPGGSNTPDAPNGRGTPNTPNGPNGRGIANASRGARALKGLGVVGAVLGAGLTAAELYSIYSAPDTTVASESSSEKFKEEEKKAQSEIKTAKTVGVIAEAGIAAGGAVAGAKIGAMIGAAGGPLGIAAGAIIGTAIGGVGSIVVGNITDSIEKAKNVEIGIKNVKDLKDQITELDTLIAKEGDQDTERKRKLLELRAQVLKDLENATKSNVNTLIANFNSHNEDLANNTGAMAQISKMLKQKQAELKEYEEDNKSISDTTGYKNEIERRNKEMLTLRRAITGLAGGEFNVEEGESLDDAIKRIAADVSGENGWGIFSREAAEDNAAQSQDAMEKFLKDQFIDGLTNGTMHESLDDLKNHDIETIEAFVKQQGIAASLSEKALRELTDEVIKMARGEKEFNEWQMRQEQQNTNTHMPITFAAHGGIYNNFTPAVVGEAGKEAVVPLERPEDMRRVLSSLSASEKFKLIKALLGSNSKKLTWDLLSNVMLKALGIGSFGPTAQEKSEYDAALAKLDAWQGGKLKPADFIAMFGPIAREDMRATGIPAAITIAQAALESGWGKTAKADFRNLFGIKGKGDAGSKVIPTHEFTAAGVRYNKRDTFAQYSSYLASINAHSQYLLTAKRKKGLNGLRYGEALLYTDDSDMFARKLKECGYATSPTYAEKLIGLMRQHDMYRYNISSSAVRPGSTLNHIKNSTEFKAANATKSTTNGTAPTVNKAQGILSDAEIKEILSAAGLSNTTAMKQYIEYAKLLVGNANNKDDIIAVLLEIARYLKGIAAAPANKLPMMSVARPYTPAYGT
jgi:uncharacterized membrane protein YgaE (UPF0421/DUF939 family)